MLCVFGPWSSLAPYYYHTRDAYRDRSSGAPGQKWIDRLGQNRRGFGEKYLTLTVMLIDVNPTFLDM